MHINRKRQSDHPSARDAQTSAQEAAPGRLREGRYSLQRVTLACFGVLGTAGLLALAGCPANLENPERFDVQAATGGGNPGGGGGPVMTGVDLTCVTAVFSGSCATSAACHVANSITGLDLASPDFEHRLINVTAMHMLSGVTDCPTVKLIDPAGANKSWLLSKITPGAFGDCGSLMPLGATAAAPMLQPSDIACITKFVNDEVAAASGMAPAAAAGGAAAGATTAGTGGM